MSEAHRPESLEADRQSDIAALAGAYRLIADCFVYPGEVDRSEVVTRAREEVLPAVSRQIDDDAAALLSSFLEEYRTVDADEYVQTLELAPECPLYLGHYEFDEPETCREIADADRNQYMVELNGIYEHFGFEIDDELPDFLPAMVEFLWLTLPDREDDLRDEFVEKTVSLLPGMIEQFEDAETPYWQLLRALELVMRWDLEHDTGGGA